MNALFTQQDVTCNVQFGELQRIGELQLVLCVVMAFFENENNVKSLFIQMLTLIGFTIWSS